MSVRAVFEFLRQWRVFLEVAFMLAVTGVYVVLVQKGFYPLHIIENRVGDWRRGTRPAPDDLIIIGIDDSSFPQQPWTAEELSRTPELAYLTPNWPWSRELWGKLTDRLLGAGARTVVFDLAFVNPGDGDAQCGAVFARQAAHLAITGMMDVKLDNVGNGAMRTAQIFDPVDELIPETGPEIVGLANVVTDEDGLVRRIRHAYNLDLEKNPELANNKKFMATLKADSYSLSWIAAQKALGNPPGLDPWDATEINYYGPSRWLHIIPIEDVFLNWDTTLDHGKYFKGKNVIVGATSYTRFKDYFDTPMGSLPGVEIQATAFANLVHGDWLRQPAAWVAPALAIIFGLLALLVSMRVNSVLWKIGLLLGLGALFWFVTQWIFDHNLVIVPVTGAFLGLVVCGGFGTIYDFVLERYERRRMLGVFETMVSPGVAALVLSDREGFESRLGGQRRDLVVLFSDIRGFTTWSEKVGAEALVAQLNEYFQGMVEVIQQEGGTVQKYIGDALMAAWGDVREVPLQECALQSVRAAWRMMAALEQLNAGWVGKEKREQLGFGIGLNLGEGVVGRVGHTRRQEFTVMGDAVNLAARLESATKQYHQTILVGEGIYEHAKGEFYFRLADKMQVKGKTVAVPVYTPIGPKTDMPPPPGLAEYDTAVEKYYARDFAGAAELFKAANHKMGGDDYLCENFVNRCEFYLQEPPAADWDGGWVLKEK